MKKISDERLDQLLTEYCEADGQQSFTFHPDEKREKIIPFARINRTVLAAASLVLVSVLSLTVYFLFGNKNHTPVPVAPSPYSVITPSSPTGESDDPSGQPDPAAPTEPKSGLQQIMDWLFPKPTTASGTPNRAVSPTEEKTDPTAPSTKETTKPDSSVKPTEKKSSDSTEPRYWQPPTQSGDPMGSGYTKPTRAPEPTVPCDPPSNDPTEGSPDPWSPEETSSPWDNEPGYVDPTEGGGTMAAPSPEIYAYIDSASMDNVTHVYCKVYDSSGRRLGSPELFDSTHIAYILDISQSCASLLYEAPRDVITQPGYYSFVFYDQNGRVLAQVQEYWE